MTRDTWKKQIVAPCATFHRKAEVTGKSRSSFGRNLYLYRFLYSNYTVKMFKTTIVAGLVATAAARNVQDADHHTFTDFEGIVKHVNVSYHDINIILSW